jgi:Phospholipase_D-nuclease N-terminal
LRVLVAYTFGQGLAAAALVAFLFVWAVVAIRIVRRDDLGALGKVLWIVGILVVPLGGLLVYFIWDAARPRTT